MLQEIELETSLNEPTKYSDENNDEPEKWIPPVVKTVNLNNQIEKDLLGTTSESATLTRKKAGDGQQYTQSRTDVFSKANSTPLKENSESVSSTKLINQAATDQKLHLDFTEIKKEVKIVYRHISVQKNEIQKMTIFAFKFNRIEEETFWLAERDKKQKYFTRYTYNFVKLQVRTIRK